MPFELHIKSSYLHWWQLIKQQTQRGSIRCIRWVLDNDPDEAWNCNSRNPSACKKHHLHLWTAARKSQSKIMCLGTYKHCWWWFLSHHAITAPVTKTHNHPLTMAMMSLRSKLFLLVRLHGVDILSHLPHQLTAAWTLL